MKNEEKFIRRERGADIVLELQREVLESSVEVSYLLRKALRAARKLKIIDQASWIQSELEGYLAINGNYYALPKYRFVKSKIDYEKSTSSGTEFHDPLLSGRSPSDPNENTEDYPCHVSIAEIERWLKGKTPDNYVHISCQPDVEKVLIETMKLPPSIVLTVQVSRLHGILDAVRKKIVDWTSELEENGIIVEDPPAHTGEGEPQKPTKKRAYTPWPKPAQEAVGKLWSSYRTSGGKREIDCYEEHKGTERLPERIKSFDDFQKCKECAERNGIIPRLAKKRGKTKGKPCQ
ncbi:MAG: hypothetical protein RBT78_14030 [Kiritimatiellia bacterium]|jgi:hypothetical protein|nr:hypothetical protein [Kiritimatiellia bacterium]